jgi:multiple sugar transport system substrate-binding protein
MEPPARPGLTRRELLRRGGGLAGVTAAAGGASSVLAACASGSSAGGSGPLSFWNFYGPTAAKGTVPAQSDWFVKTAKDWNASHKTQVQLQYIPNPVYINGSKLQTAFAAGTGPDIFLLSPGDFLRYYNGGVLQDLTPYMSQQARSDFYPSVMSTRTVDGKIYGLPMEVEPMAFYYSEKAWERAGLSEGDIPQTWDKLLGVADKLKSVTKFGMAFEVNPGYYQNFTWYPFMWQGHGDAVAADQRSSNFGSPGAIAALTLWQDSIKQGLAPRTLLGTGGGDIVANLTSGYTGILNCGIWGVAALRAVPNFRYGVFKLPVPPGGSYTTVLGGWAFVVNKKGKNPDEAARFVVWALGSMAQDSIGRMVDWCITAKSDIAPRKSALTQAEKLGGYSSAQLTYFKDVVFPAGRGEPRYPPPVYNAVSQALQACQLGGAAPASRAQQAAATINDYLKTYNGAAIR